MSYFVWRSEYSVGNDLIDSQHRHLLELAGLLRRALATGQAVSIVEEALRALQAYVSEHFAEEEALFDAIGSPASKAHRRQHQLIVVELEELLADQALGYRHLERKLVEWVEDRLVGHLIRDDRAAAAKRPRLATGAPDHPRKSPSYWRASAMPR